MGGFLDETAKTRNPASPSELRCGAALAALIPAKYMVVAVPPSGHRAAVGGVGATADFVVYTGGNAPGVTYRTLEEDENKWGTVDAYTPESRDPAQVASKVIDKLSTQARSVIVDLVNLRNTTDRDAAVRRVISAVGKRRDGAVIFLFEGKCRVHNPIGPFPDTEEQFV